MSMSVVDSLLGILAPHCCMECGAEGSVVCDWCIPDFAPPLPERCYLCKAESKSSAVCKKCRRKSLLQHVWVRTSYEKKSKQLVHDFKFEHKLAAAITIAQLMSESLPYLPKDTIIVHIPTATSRVRQRGYDHSEKLAKALSNMLNLHHRTFLARTTQTRQVGASRTDRISQMNNAFRYVGGKNLQGQTILLVDDITTTGATLEAAAKCLKYAGAKRIDAVVFAQK